MVLLALLGFAGCGQQAPAFPDEATFPGDDAGSRQARDRMVRDQIEARGVRDVRVLEAMRVVPRHLFVPPEMRIYSYADSPLPIGEGQTISQPYIVAYMSEALALRPGDRVLEIGTGSGYQAAVLARLCREVYSMEIIPALGKAAAERLAQMGFSNVRVRVGDGYKGWPEAAPFDAIIVTAAPERLPQALVDQLAAGGRMVLPLGRGVQDLVRIRRTAKGIARESLLPVRFVPMVTAEELKPTPPAPR